MKLILLVAGWHLRWMRRRPAQMLLLPAGLVLAFLGDHTGQAPAQAVAYTAPLAVIALTLGWNDSRLRAYLRATAARRSGALLSIALEGWLLPLLTAAALAEGAALGLEAGGAFEVCWQGHLTIAFTALATSSAMAFSAGRPQRLVAAFIGALLVLQLLLRPGTAPVAEVLLPTAWPALSLASAEGEAAYHADIYMGLSMLLGVGLSVGLGRRGLGRPDVPQLSESLPGTQGG
jgi:hypothetical protein